MARAMHHYMVKSSSNVFRARFVIPTCDWPKILDDYDMIEDSAGRTRIGAGVLVTELAGPRGTNRVLCVTAHTASVFVDVLHRLMCGLAGDRDAVATRLLVGREDFESATVGQGLGGIEVIVDELRQAAAVNISESFEQFNVYPLVGETALRIVGRPSAVVHCVCLVNELLCETATAMAANLVAAGRRPSRREDSTNRPASDSRPKHLGWTVFAPLVDQYYSPSGYTATATYWPAADPRLTTPVWGPRLAHQYSPLSPIDTYSNFPAADPGSVPPVWGARLADRFSPLSPTETNSDWTAVDPRPATPVWSASERLPDQYSPQSPINTTTYWPPVDPRLCTSTPIWSVMNRNQLQRLETAFSTRSTTPIQPVSNPLIVNRQPSQSRVTTSAFNTRPTTSVPSVSNHLVNQNPSSGLATATTTQNTNSNTTVITARPATFVRSVSDHLVNSNLSLRVTTTATNSANDRHSTPICRISIELIVNQQPPSSLVTTNATATTNLNVTPAPRVSVRLIMNRRPSPSNVTTDDTTATTSTIGQSSSESGDTSQTVPFPIIDPL